LEVRIMPAILSCEKCKGEALIESRTILGFEFDFAEGDVLFHALYCPQCQTIVMIRKDVVKMDGNVWKYEH
jgi:cytochrome c-type biogenesis protein CcmH/NrfF